MCTEAKTSTKVQRTRGSLRLLTSRRAKSVIIKLKQWMGRVRNVEAGFGATLKMSNDESAERQNLSNENKLNVVKSKMAYTVEELRDIVDDNLANELKETEAISAQE